jgi:DNA-binding LacI/PurR family transcriptional regulator
LTKLNHSIDLATGCKYNYFYKTINKSGKQVATIRDVAKKANVHSSTVSRVFSGNLSISEATRERVFAAAKELGFWPNAIARSLSTQRTNTIGIVIPHIFEGFFNDSFFPQLMRGMLEASYKKGFRLIVGGCENYEDEIDQIKQIMASSQADGIIVMSSRLDVDTVGELQNHNTPFVLIGHPPSGENQGIAWVDADNQKATQEAVQYLIDLGHKKIAFVGGDPENLTSQEREKSFNTTLDLAGIPRDPNLVHHGFFDESGGFNSVARMLKLGENSPTAFYAANDLMAVGIIRALKKNNIRVPEDISVIGTNNAPISEYAQPAISTVDVPYAKMAGKAVEMLIEKIEQGEMSQTNFTLECSLVLRDSTAEFQN